MNSYELEKMMFCYIFVLQLFKIVQNDVFFLTNSWMWVHQYIHLLDNDLLYTFEFWVRFGGRLYGNNILHAYVPVNKEERSGYYNMYKHVATTNEQHWPWINARTKKSARKKEIWQSS